MADRARTLAMGENEKAAAGRATVDAPFGKALVEAGRARPEGGGSGCGAFVTAEGTASGTTFSKIAPSGARMNSTGVAHSSRYSASRALRALVTAWSTGRPSARQP